MGRKLKCVKCGKIIGEVVNEGTIDAGKFIGRIPLIKYKKDYRKAAHVNTERGDGICKTCARKVFTEGKSYAVVFDYYGKEKTFLHGLSEYDYRYVSKAQAQADCDMMNGRFGLGRYKVVEYNL